MERIRAAAARYPSLGPWLWVLCIAEYFAAQVYVASAWPRAFSLQRNYISDLGSTSCGYLHHSVYVCSPLHAVMNLTFVLVGLALGLGAALMYANFRPTTAAKVAFSLLCASGFGTALVGLVPENTAGLAHFILASTLLAIFNIGVGCMYWLPDLPFGWRLYSLVSCGIGLGAMVLLGFSVNTPIGLGGMERIADYTPDLWIVLFGLYVLRRTKFSKAKLAPPPVLR